MDDGIPVGKVAGFPVRIHWSVLVILWLFTWSLASLLPDMARGYPSSTYWVAGFCGAVVLLASLLAHELTHSIVARRNGIQVTRLQLWLFGGLSRLGSEAKTPGIEFRIAAAGPAMSLALAAFFGGAAAFLRAAGTSDIVVAVVWWLAGINLVLGLFNLLPGAPLDGGRILRAYLWHRYGDARRAAIGAARAGRSVALALIGLGLLEFLLGSLVSGVWMAFIGWFLLTAAREEEAFVRTRASLAGLTVTDVMTAHPHTAPGWISVDDFIRDYLLGDRHSSYPVERADGTISGLITLDQLRRIPAGQRATALLSDAAIPLEQVPTARPTEPVTALLERIEPAARRRVVVMDDEGRVVGIVTANDIARLVDVRMLAMSRPAA
ncbi:MAG TPA: site-2 protease family protein [Mycobacterium sp.]|nr:site-2 protease family protein [Mycobacterium sp.]